MSARAPHAYDRWVRVLVLQHIACEPPGVFEDVLHERDAELHRVELDEGELVPDWRAFDAIVAMGGPMSVNDDAELPWLADEKRASATPFVGARRTGAFASASSSSLPPWERSVYPGPHPEVGLLPVNLTAEGRADPVFGPVQRDLVTLQWHGDTFDLPAGAVRLASSPAYANQAFRFERATASSSIWRFRPRWRANGPRFRSTSPRSKNARSRGSAGVPCRRSRRTPMRCARKDVPLRALARPRCASGVGRARALLPVRSVTEGGATVTRMCPGGPTRTLTVRGC